VEVAREQVEAEEKTAVFKEYQAKHQDEKRFLGFGKWLSHHWRTYMAGERTL
jgi:hypothetical protein